MSKCILSLVYGPQVLHWGSQIPFMFSILRSACGVEWRGGRLSPPLTWWWSRVGQAASFLEVQRAPWNMHLWPGLWWEGTKPWSQALVPSQFPHSWASPLEVRAVSLERMNVALKDPWESAFQHFTLLLGIQSQRGNSVGPQITVIAVHFPSSWRLLKVPKMSLSAAWLTGLFSSPWPLSKDALAMEAGAVEQCCSPRC
jgi:hypothetical protein